MKDTVKTILFSTLVSLNVVIWYEVFGFKFVLFMVVVMVALLLLDYYVG